MRPMLCVLCFVPILLFSQTSEWLDFVKNNKAEVNSGVILQNHKNKSATSILLYPSYWMYKQYISSQDGAMCSFYPSCANYGLQAVSRKGLLGIFYSIDRVTRCHGIYPHIYHSHGSGLNMDEVH